MRSMNVHIVSGNIGGYVSKVRENDKLVRKVFETPVMSKTPSGKKLIVVLVAMNVDRKKGDEWVTEPIWKEFKFWENDAAFLAEYSAKGNFIVVNYEEIPNTWVDQETGEKRYGKDEYRVTSFNLPKTSGGSGKRNTNDEEFEAMTVPTSTPDLTDEDLADIPV